jgi:uncharacterized protein (DUF2267 family)
MSYETFIETVSRRGELDQDAARTASETVLGELAASLTWAQSQRTAGYLPGPLRKVMMRRSFESSMARFSPSTFISRVAEQEAVDDRTAAIHVKAVLETLDGWLPVPVAKLMYEELPGLWRELSRSIPPQPEEQTPQRAAE